MSGEELIEVYGEHYELIKDYVVTSKVSYETFPVYVNIFGDVIYIEYGNVKYVNQYINKNGYIQVSVTNIKTHKKNEYVHRLVALAFIPNPNKLPCVNHKDENKSNNRVDNLEWCSYKYNSNYGTRNEKISKANKNRFKNFTEEDKRKISKNKMGANNPNAKKIRCVELDIEFDTALEAAKDLGFVNLKSAASNIRKCARGIQKKAYNYRWEYVKD